MDGFKGLRGFSACRADPNGTAAVEADILTPKWVSNAAASLQISFGPAGVLAWLIHAVGVEVYLRFTQSESGRLTRESLRRQAGQTSEVQILELENKDSDV